MALNAPDPAVRGALTPHLPSSPAPDLPHSLLNPERVKWKDKVLIEHFGVKAPQTHLCHTCAPFLFTSGFCSTGVTQSKKG